MNSSRSDFLSRLPAATRREAQQPVARRLLSEYGAIFAAGGGAVPPDRIIFENEDQVSEFQSSVDTRIVEFGEISIELQLPAAEALDSAVSAANSTGYTISPRSADSGKRNYASTEELWLSRVEPALEHWTTNGRVAGPVAERIRSLPPFAQVPEIFSLEERGIYFAKDLSKSIIYSVAPPCASQHLAMLAFDVAEFNDAKVREILAEHFWYQTVISDLPHFTFLGVPRNELPARNLKVTTYFEREFWIPDL